MFGPRVVIVTRPSEIEGLVARHGTLEQARFVLGDDGRFQPLLERHRQREAALATIGAALLSSWRRIRLDRSELDRFVFEPDDVIVSVGQDGLVANVAKYLDGQPVIGVDPAPGAASGVLARHGPESVAETVHLLSRKRAAIAERTMVEATFEDGQRLLALNEIFVGHRSHQSARYELFAGDRFERQSSSGVIVSTGTGATGWARSIDRDRSEHVALPAPGDVRLAYFVREAFPGAGFSAEHTSGYVDAEARLLVRSEMNDGGVVFGDGIEDDRVDFAWGVTARIGIARERLHLVAA